MSIEVANPYAYYLFVALTGSIVALQSPPLCARASGEEELEEEKDEMRKMSWTFSGENGYHCLLYRRTFASTVLFAQFPLCRTLAGVSHCITVYKQPPPTVHNSTTVLPDTVKRCLWLNVPPWPYISNY